MCLLPKAEGDHTFYMYCMHVAMATCVAAHVPTVVHHVVHATSTICALYMYIYYIIVYCINTINNIALCFHCTFPIHNVKNNLCDI